MNKAGFFLARQRGKQANSYNTVFKSRVDSPALGFDVIKIQIVGNRVANKRFIFYKIRADTVLHNSRAHHCHCGLGMWLHLGLYSVQALQLYLAALLQSFNCSSIPQR